MITHVTGDLFTSENSLAHCVSRDFKMSRGIAVQFREKFGQIDILRNQQKCVGDVAFIRDGDRYIFYLITKDRYFHKPSYDSLQSCLIVLLELCRELNITKISMPRIGSGLDGLVWSRVEKILEDVFEGRKLQIEIYNLKLG